MWRRDIFIGLEVEGGVGYWEREREREKGFVDKVIEVIIVIELRF